MGFLFKKNWVLHDCITALMKGLNWEPLEDWEPKCGFPYRLGIYIYIYIIFFFFKGDIFQCKYTNTVNFNGIHWCSALECIYFKSFYCYSLIFINYNITPSVYKNILFNMF
jgi:hypothetical protein